MKITADTNVLVRAIVGDDELQSAAARKALADAEAIALTIPALCELVWVLSRVYKIPAPEISKTIRSLMNAANVEVNRPAAEAGLELLEAGGDFADGVTAFEGSWLGADVFVSFDKKAVELVDARGKPARLLV
ncbi:MAG: type II toxin-antitoxin system VapC family toxin [Rhodomicrobium sp.]